jgi:cellulose synthase/poly-beta-1,6-N-acetylglucosamine synthase-like glycosyltransferase
MRDYGRMLDTNSNLSALTMASSIATLLALFLLSLGWLLYPLGLALMPRRRRVRADPAEANEQTVTVVIATREAPDAVVSRVESLYTTDWPHDRLHVVIGVDPNAGTSLERYRESLRHRPGITVVLGDSPGGKAATLNAAVREVNTALFIFADSAQQFDPAAIGKLVAALQSPDVGGVTGEIRTDAEQGVFGLFWRFELMLRQLESRLGLVVNVTGAIHAIRRSCWQPLPAGLICDDLLIPLQIGRQGWRTEVASGARARDPRQMSREVQLRRKIRTLTGVLQICRWQPWVLVPWRNRLWAAFVCHKLLRIATPLLVVIFLAGAALSLPAWWLYAGAAATVIVGGLGVLGLLVMRRPLLPVIRECGWFIRMLSAPVVATGRALKGDWKTW